MSFKEVDTIAFDDQKPGTAGLRKSVKRFQTPHYLENFVQSVFDAVPALKGDTLVLGGDGRFYNREAAASIIRMAHANGVQRVVVGQGALLSTPAAAHLIAQEQATGGFLLTASHNPGGPDGDFGIKFNVAGGGQASAELTDRIHAISQAIERYWISELSLPSLDETGQHEIDGMVLDVVDPVSAHADLLEAQFDFPRIRQWLSEKPERFVFDALHAITGPYAREIFCRRLGAPMASVLNSQPKDDFGGGHPDPNPHDAAGFVQGFRKTSGAELGAASDGDGDRNMILGPHRMVSPCDSLAVIAANHDCIPALAGNLKGVARSMPTSRALDEVARSLEIPCHETPTGWRFFASLLEGGHIRLCGEESFGTSSDHVREKDGLWAVLAWMQMMAARGLSVDELLEAHWRRFGRHYFVRHDFALNSEQGEAVIQYLGKQADQGHPDTESPGHLMDRFHYTDPVSGHRVENQGIRLSCPDGARVVFRLSGTGTKGATLRIYLEQPVPADGDWRRDRQTVLAPLAQKAAEVAGLKSLAGRETADVII
ncbi:phosphoglucomutase [Natronospira proteinivora]|uniref:phosphoglucomutase (alpha-D-glucose-1,6-bisphosphate-dependent) n=1 Tax=Natronospira proteinivora TaxID=1807133 RepID=A0ABT1G5E5_9GAMM|nr:alpha-D-glucose phosphate-specific phosphoglucomutase [Natronospira proteinivora]MCP1726510.1 phosphoglucomutase [Natronospira proteinivora]